MYGVPPFERRGTIACDGGGFLTRALERLFTEGETALHLPPEYINSEHSVYCNSACGGTTLLHSRRELSTARPTVFNSLISLHA